MQVFHFHMTGVGQMGLHWVWMGEGSCCTKLPYSNDRSGMIFVRMYCTHTVYQKNTYIFWTVWFAIWHRIWTKEEGIMEGIAGICRLPYSHVPNGLKRAVPWTTFTAQQLESRWPRSKSVSTINGKWLCTVNWKCIWVKENSEIHNISNCLLSGTGRHKTACLAVNRESKKYLIKHFFN